jgi:DNA-binding response OmpR family regulator
MTTGRPTLLIVEKDAATRELYRRELGRSYAVVAAEDAYQALEVLRSERVEAVILEPVTADDIGWDLISAIRALPNQPPIPVILCSALDERRRGLSLGAAAYLVKPVLPSSLLATLRQILPVHSERRGV